LRGLAADGPAATSSPLAADVCESSEDTRLFESDALQRKVTQIKTVSKKAKDGTGKHRALARSKSAHDAVRRKAPGTVFWLKRQRPIFSV